MACRPFQKEEIAVIFRALKKGRMAKRNTALFALGLFSGFRISELLSIQIGDVINPTGEFWPEISVRPQDMKADAKHNQKGRSVPLYDIAKPYLTPWIKELQNQGYLGKDNWVFCSITGKQMNRQTALKILKKAFFDAGIYGKPYQLGTHSMRKTYSQSCMDKIASLNAGANGTRIEPIPTLQRLLGHKKIDSTIHYVPGIEEDYLLVRKNLFNEGVEI